MATQFPNGPSWRDLKKELMERWHQLTEHELDRTRGETESIVELIERKVGMAIEDASEKYAEIASHYHLYDEPEDKSVVDEEKAEKKEKVMELSPKKPADVDPKPRDNFHG